MWKLKLRKIQIYIFTILLMMKILKINCQENSQLRVPKSLEECYRSDYLLQRDNRLPMTMSSLIELIEKIENTSGYNQDIRTLSISLLHRFRQDGITQATGVQKSDSVLPYSPNDFQFSKHRILLSRLLPGNAFNFPNDTLTSLERCSLHFMLSSTFEKRVRGDEQQRCNQLSQYRSMRIPRDIDDKYRPKFGKHNNFLGDVEILETIQSKIKSKPSIENGKFQTYTSHPYTPNYDREPPFDVDFEENYNRDIIDIASDAISPCPVESGVVWTPWGAVSAGTVIAGIAAGLQPQKVQLRALLALARRPGVNGRQFNTYVDNKWAATLAGDLAEVALIQAPLVPNSQVTVGAAGAWNSTASQRWYFLTQREKLEMTDAEIRGGIDGLIMANKIVDWRNKVSNLKLSQLLRMYYSQEGVLDTGIRACDRRKFFTEVAPIEEMKAQTLAFAIVLDREIQLRVTLEEDGIKNFAQRAAEALSTYVPQSLNDLSCEATAPIPNDPTIWKTATNMYIFLDTSWEYQYMNPILSYIIDRIDVGKYGSRVTLMNANDCKFIVNTTDSTSDVYETWNRTTQQQHPNGFNLPNILRKIHNLSVSLMNEEKQNSSSGGRSLIALIVANMAGVNEGDTYYALQQIQILSEEVPDLKILYIANGAVQRFSQFVTDPNKDLFTARLGDENIAVQAKPIIKRIREIPRRIINHRCGSNWRPDGYGISQMNQYVTPGSVNFYRLHPNYFYRSSDNRKLRIQGQSSLGLTVCTSRQIELPRMNSTQKDNIDCRQLVSDTYEIDLNNQCNGQTYIHTCPPFYISAEVSRTVSTSSQSPCVDPECQRPDQVKFVIQHENLGCFSCSERNIQNFIVLLIGLLCSIITRR